jgi:quinol monooxygenase YgiN
MSESIYTLGVWRVKPGREAEFIEAWKGLSAEFSRLENPPGGHGTLVQSLSEPQLFYSWGEWPSLEAIQAMRQDPTAQAGIKKIAELCAESVPGTFKLVASA